MKQELCSKQVRLLTHEFKINKQAVRDDNYEVKTNTKEIAEVFKKKYCTKLYSTETESVDRSTTNNLTG